MVVMYTHTTFGPIPPSRSRKKRICIPPPGKGVFLTFDLDLVTLTFMSLEDQGVVVMYTYIEIAITKYGNKCLTKHKQHETPPKLLDLFFLNNMT